MVHIAAYITGHGFGHATRMAAVIGALAERLPQLTVSLVSTAPEWLFQLNLSVPFRFRARALDVGVVQRDSIHLDAPGTLGAYAHALERQDALIEEEAAILQRESVDLVIADIPPAAFPIARRAGIPGVGMATFRGTGFTRIMCGAALRMATCFRRSGMPMGRPTCFSACRFTGRATPSRLSGTFPWSHAGPVDPGKRSGQGWD